jgi:hypothetical protein
MINNEFQVHILNEDGIERAKQLAATFDAFLEQLKKLCLHDQQKYGGILLAGNAYNGREFAIVRTKLEEASFFAKKALAMLPENQK